MHSDGVFLVTLTNIYSFPLPYGPYTELGSYIPESQAILSSLHH